MLTSFIQSLYDPSLPLPDQPAFYTQMAEEIEHFSLSPQIYCLLKKDGRLHKTPSLFQERLESNYKKALYQNIWIKKQTDQVLQAFEKAGILVISLKGVHFAEQYFGHLGARWTSDIDILINKADVSHAIHLVKSLGYSIEDKQIPSHFHYSLSKALPHSPVPLTIELHWNLLQEQTSNLNMEEFWREAKPLQGYQYAKQLSPYHTFYMICLHGWRHHLNSLKYFFDIIHMIHSLGDELDFQLLFHDATDHQTLNRMLKTLTIVYDQFPYLELIKPLPIKKRSRFWWEYEGIRNHNHKTYRQYLSIIDFEFCDFDTAQHSVRALFQCLFPRRT